MQYESLDDRTRAMLINMTSIVLDDVGFQRTQTFYKSIIIQVFAFEFDCSQICDEENVKEIIYQTIRENTYDEVFSLIEFIVQKMKQMNPWKKDEYAEDYNTIFKNEYVGYRFVNEIIVPITDENEIEAINRLQIVHIVLLIHTYLKRLVFCLIEKSRIMKTQLKKA